MAERHCGTVDGVRRVNTFGAGVPRSKAIPNRFDLVVVVRVLGGGAQLLEDSQGVQVLHELIDIVHAPRDDSHRQHDPAVLAEGRPHRGDPDLVGQRRFELVEERGPRERALLDELERLLLGKGAGTKGSKRRKTRAAAAKS